MASIITVTLYNKDLTQGDGSKNMEKGRAAGREQLGMGSPPKEPVGFAGPRAMQAASQRFSQAT